MTYTPLSTDAQKAFERYQKMRAEVIRLRIQNAQNEGIIALTTTIENSLQDSKYEHAALLADLNQLKAEAYESMEKYPMGRTWFGEKASNSLHHTGLIEES